jgi:hypothetical protein
MSDELTRLAVDGDPLVRVTLVPVQVFGADEENCPGCGEIVRCGYGLMDAVSAWSDCNRAIGHIYRREDMEGRNAEGAAGCITVYVPQSEMAKFERRYGDSFDDRCPACHVEYRELPEGHRLKPSPPMTGALVT